MNCTFWFRISAAEGVFDGPKIEQSEITRKMNQNLIFDLFQESRLIIVLNKFDNQGVVLSVEIEGFSKLTFTSLNDLV